MSELRLHPAIEDALRSFLRTQAPIQAPNDLLARVLAIPEAAPRPQGRGLFDLLAGRAASVAVVAVLALLVAALALSRAGSFPGVGAKPGPGNAVAWATPYVSLSADDLRIEAGSREFTSAGAAVDVHSDPGGPTYRTLELGWLEAGVETRLYLYLAADATDWWVSSIRTYDGLPNTTGSNWIYYDGPFFRTRLGGSYQGDVDLKSSRSDNGVKGRLVMSGLRLRAFAVGASDAPSQSLSGGPCPGAPSDAVCVNLEPSAAPGSS